MPVGLEQPVKQHGEKKGENPHGRVFITLGGRHEAHIVAAMFVPDHFREDRPDVLHHAMRQIGFATLVTQGWMPTICRCCSTDGVLRGHVSRANPVWKSGDG